MSYWNGKRVLVTGGTGFIGSHCVERLLEHGAHVRVIGRNRDSFEKHLHGVEQDVDFQVGDLTDVVAIDRAVAAQDMLVHHAAFVARIGYNVDHPASMIQRNLELGVPTMTTAAQAGVERIVCVSSACVYPRHCSVPTPESEGFDDDPEPTNFGYGWAKRLLEVHARAIHEEFGSSVAIVRPYNGYGPRDNFSEETSHVIPALIKRADAAEDVLEIWGDGTQTRSFLYVTDFVDGILTAAEHEPNSDPINIGTHEEVTIGELAQHVINTVNPKLRLEFDTTKPRGQPRRAGHLDRADAIGFSAQVSLPDGLERTFDWYRRTIE